MGKNSPFKRADVGLMRGARAAYEEVHYKGELISEPVMKATDKILEDYEKKLLKQQIDQERLAGAIQKNKQATKLTGGWNYGDGQKVFGRQMNEWSDEFAALEKRKIALRDAGMAGGEEWMEILDQQADITEYAGEIKAQLDALETKRQAYFDANDPDQGGNLSSASGGKSLQNGIYLKDYSIEIKKDANGRPIVGFRVDGKFVSHEDVDKNNISLINGLGDSLMNEGQLHVKLGQQEGSDWETQGKPRARQYVKQTFKTNNDIISGFYDSYDGNLSPYEEYMEEYNKLTPDQRITQGMTIEPLSPESFGEVGSSDANTLNWMKERISDTYVNRMETQFTRGVTAREKAEQNQNGELTYAQRLKRKQSLGAAKEIDDLVQQENPSVLEMQEILPEGYDIVQEGNEYIIYKGKEQKQIFHIDDKKALRTYLYKYSGRDPSYGDEELNLPEYEYEEGSTRENPILKHRKAPGPPVKTDGEEGKYYKNTSSGQVYLFTGGEWKKVGEPVEPVEPVEIDKSKI